MKISGENTKRLGIYFFFEKEGIVDQFVEFFLQEYSKCQDQLIIVVNGNLQEKGKNILKKYTEDVIVRDNVGLDVWAYKTAFDYLGWKELERFDEVTIANCTVMGPVYSLQNVYNEMANRDLDFWGMTKYFKFAYSDLGGRIPYGYIPEHIQSYYMVYRSSLIKSKEFQEYWNNMPLVENYHDSIGFFESIFTKKFGDMGFKWDTYVEMDDMQNLTWYAMLDYPMEMIKYRKCPFFKRRSFLEDYDTVQDSTLGQACSNLYQYLEQNHLYDMDMVWENILRTCHQSDIVKNLHLYYILPVKDVDKDSLNKKLENRKIALFMHLYFMDLLDNSFEYASAMPAFADIYVTTDSETKKKQIEETFKNLECNNLDVRVVTNRGRDVSGLLIGLHDVPEKYDYACFFHDKKAGQEYPGSIGDSFGYKCAENVLHNQDFVYGILDTFEKHSRLGMLSPLEPNHGPYFPTLGDEWHDNFDITKELADKLGVHVPMSADKEPVAPLGSVFWYRPRALKKLQEYPWKYDDFPAEPLAVDHTISHAIERVRPFVVQDAGYYPAFVMSSEYARIEYTNLHQYVRNYNVMLKRNGILEGTQKDVICRVDDFCNGKYHRKRKEPFYMQVAVTLEKLLPSKIYDPLIGLKRKVFGPHDLV